MSEKKELALIESPNYLIELALKDNVDISKLEKLLELRDKWEDKEAAKAFKMAMVDFQKDKPEMVKTSKVEFGKTKYNFNPLPKIQKAIDPVLSEYGLSYSWKQSQENDKLTVTCIISHIDGHTEENSLTSPLDNSGGKNLIQSLGSAVSYLKRYTLEASLGLSSDEDDDGDKAPDELPELKPAMDVWKEAKKALLEGTVTVAQIEKKYKLTDTNRKNLWGILHEQLSEAFENYNGKISGTQYEDIERIIENKETLSYKKAIDLLTSAE